MKDRCRETGRARMDEDGFGRAAPARRATRAKDAPGHPGLTHEDTMKIYIDGKYYDEKNARISVLDHGLLYGDGVFEGIRAYNGRVFKLSEHIDRLFCSAKAILLAIPMTREEMMQAVLARLPPQPGARRLCPAGGHARGRVAGAESPPLQKPVGHHHCGQNPALSGRALPAGPGDHHRADRAQFCTAR